MSEKQSIIQQYRQWPRAMQWATLAIIGLALFLLWDVSIQPLTERWKKRVGVIESQVARVRDNEEVARDLRDPSMSQWVTAIGPVRVPPFEAEGSKMFNDVVLEVLNKHRASSAVFSSRPGSRLPRNALVELTEGKSRIDRLTGDVKFDATPDAALAIIADLEASPHIDSVSGVRLVRDAGGKVKVTLTIESWIRGDDRPTGTST